MLNNESYIRIFKGWIKPECRRAFSFGDELTYATYVTPAACNKLIYPT